MYRVIVGFLVGCIVSSGLFIYLDIRDTENLYCKTKIKHDPELKTSTSGNTSAGKQIFSFKNKEEAEAFCNAVWKLWETGKW